MSFSLRPVLWGALLVAAVLGSATLVPTALAQPTPLPGLPDRVAQGTSYSVYTEPGAPTIEVIVVRLGGAGLYRVAETTTLTELLALSGGTAPPPTSNDEIIQTSAIRVLRTAGPTRQTIYEATPEQLLREPGQHPALIDGDVVEVVTNVERVPDRVTFNDVLDVTTRVASVVSLVLLIIQVAR